MQRPKLSSSMWLKDLNLSLVNKEGLAVDGRMLSDKHMYAAHQLLSKQFLKFEGCLLAQLKAFPSITNDQGPGI